MYLVGDDFENRVYRTDLRPLAVSDVKAEKSIWVQNRDQSFAFCRHCKSGHQTRRKKPIRNLLNCNWLHSRWHFAADDKRLIFLYHVDINVFLSSRFISRADRENALNPKQVTPLWRVLILPILGWLLGTEGAPIPQKYRKIAFKSNTFLTEGEADILN